MSGNDSQNPSLIENKYCTFVDKYPQGTTTNNLNDFTTRTWMIKAPNDNTMEHFTDYFQN